MESGVSLVHPLYYDYPEASEAYEMREQFLFGDDILATTVCEPVDPSTGLAPRRVWFPEGNDWYDVATGQIYKGGQTLDLSYTLDENPWYIKAGAVIPMASDEISSLQEKSNVLKLFVAPGDGMSGCVVYEDDGLSQAYSRDFAKTVVEKRSDASSCSVVVAPRVGSYEGMDPSRRLEILLEGVSVPIRVTVNGAEASWRYVGKDLAVVVEVPEAPASQKTVVEVSYDSFDREILRGKKGVIRRMMAFTPEFKDVFNTSVDSYKLLSRPFLVAAQCGSRIEADPARLAELLESIDFEAIKKDIEEDVNEVRASGRKDADERIGRLRRAMSVIEAQGRL